MLVLSLLNTFLCSVYKTKKKVYLLLTKAITVININQVKKYVMNKKIIKLFTELKNSLMYAKTNNSLHFLQG